MLFDKETPSGCAVIVLEKAEDGSSQNRILVIPGSNRMITPEKIAFLEDIIGDYDLVMAFSPSPRRNSLPSATRTAGAI